jgi:uncharacterized membrane protein YfcA
MTDGIALAAFAHVLTETKTWFLVAVVLVAGIVRGFSGFGGALVFIPLASAILGPRLAVPIFYLVDLVTATPYGIKMIKKASMRQITPMLIGSWLAAPAGAWILSNLDPILLRWVTGVTVLVMVAILATGWRYSGEPRPPVSFGVGAAGGVLASATGASGPLIIAYWLGSRADAALIRANIMAFYALAALGTDLVYLVNGLFTLEAVFYAALAAPLYAAGLWLGSRVFKGSSETGYRRAAFALIILTSIVSLPPVTALFR